MTGRLSALCSVGAQAVRLNHTADLGAVGNAEALGHVLDLSTHTTCVKPKRRSKLEIVRINSSGNVGLNGPRIELHAAGPLAGDHAPNLGGDIPTILRGDWPSNQQTSSDQELAGHSVLSSTTDREYTTIFEPARRARGSDPTLPRGFLARALGSKLITHPGAPS